MSYIEWLLNFQSWFSENGLLYFSGMATLISYALLALVALAIRWLCFLRFIYLPNMERCKTEIIHHGPLESKSTWLANLHATTLGPFIEEITVRAPIVWFVLQRKPVYVVATFAISTLVFIGLHFLESTGSTYADGTSEYRDRYSAYNLLVGCVLYGSCVFLTASVWPAIWLHIFWNATVILVEKELIQKECVNRLALRLQPQR